MASCSQHMQNNPYRFLNLRHLYLLLLEGNIGQRGFAPSSAHSQELVSLRLRCGRRMCILTFRLRDLTNLATQK